MVPNSTNKPSYTEQEVREMQQVLLETPVDPAYDDICNSFYEGGTELYTVRCMLVTATVF